MVANVANKESVEVLVKEFRAHDKDTGSTAVQIALLSARIDTLSKHLGEFKKDVSSKRGLFTLLAQRRKLLKYLEQESEDSYKSVVKRLGLKK